MYIVTGANGHTGSVVAETLLKQGQPVRVIVRSVEKGEKWKEKGAEFAVAELDDAAALTKVFEGGEAIYLMNPPNYGSEDMLAETEKNIGALQTALKDSSIKKLVVLSSAGAFYESGTGNILTLHMLEEGMKKTGLPVTFLRPPNFMENWSETIDSVKNQNVLPSFAQPLDAPFPQIAASDIGRVAANAMLQDNNGVRIIELAGCAYSPNDVAKAFSKVLGREIVAVPIPEEQWLEVFKTFCSEKNAKLFVEMYKWFGSGADIYETDLQVETETTIGDFAKTLLTSSDTAKA